jgi:hypothetical protein
LKNSHPESKLKLGANKYADHLPIEMKKLMNFKAPLQLEEKRELT